MPGAQRYWTARELAVLVCTRGVAGLPNSERGIRRHAQREGWNELPSRLMRMRPPAEAGGRPSAEYHVSLLPDAVQTVIAAMAVRTGLRDRHALAVQDDGRKLAALKVSALAARPRAVLAARAEVLASIEGYAIANGERRAWGIGRFLAAQEAWQDRQEIERRRDRGEILTDRDLAVLARPALLVAADGFHLSPERLARAHDRAGHRGIGRATLYNWFKARDAGGVAALAPVPPKAAEPIPAGFAEFLKFYARPTKPTISDAHAQYVQAAATVEGAQPMTLSLDQVERILRERLTNIERHVGREGLLTLRSRMAYVTRTTEGMWPTTIYSADGKTFDAEIADPVTKLPIRPEITTVIDVVTRKVVGTAYARSENQITVAEALRRACVDHGIPAIFYVDRGPGYRNQAQDADVAGLMGRLGITKSHAAPYGSQAKGRVERVQATIWDVLAKRLPTYIGADMDKEAGDRIHKLVRREIKAFGQSRTLPAWEEFVAQCEAMVAEYNRRPHRSLPKFEDPATGKMRHMSPDECWAAHVEAGCEPVAVDPEEADDLFRPYEFRTVRRGLVRLYNNQYFHEALESWHEQRVMVGYDYTQADRVWVRAFDVEAGQPGRLICVAQFGGNEEAYYPQPVIRQAEEARARGRLRRNDDKRSAIEAERDALRLIEAQPVPPALFLQPPPEPVPAVASTPAGPRRRTFASDEELAAWALQHPAELTGNQAALLRECLSRPAARELFRLSGIDVEALRTLLRAAA